MALILAMCLAVMLGTIPLWGAQRGHTPSMALAPSLAMGVLVFSAISFACLATAFLQDDFSVKVVASNSNSLLPAAYKFPRYGVTTRDRCCCGCSFSVAGWLPWLSSARSCQPWCWHAYWRSWVWSP